MDKLPDFLRKPIFEKLFNIAEYTNLTKKEKNMYDSSMKYKWDKKNEIDYATATGEAKGREAERAKALKEKKAIASDLKKEGLSVEFIAKTTKLSIEEIEKL